MVAGKEGGDRRVVAGENGLSVRPGDGEAIAGARGGDLGLHTGRSFLNLVKSNEIWIVITLFQWIKRQTEFNLVLNLSETCNYNLNLV